MPFRTGGSLNCISKIKDYLYICGSSALKKDSILSKKVTFFVSATIDGPSISLSGVDYMNVRIEDEPTANIEDYFDSVADRIKWTRDAGGRTLVHCVAGVSRSATLCIVYLMKHEKMSLREAYYCVKEARPIIRPNPGFWRQMIEYERSLRGGESSVQLVFSRWNTDPIPDVYQEDRRRRSSLSTLAHLAPSAPGRSPTLNAKKYSGAGQGQSFLASFYHGSLFQALTE